MHTKRIKLIECPRDAMQGLKKIISTENKVDYINRLLQVGFDTLDCGSFVSHKAIPQMADTKEVLSKLTSVTKTKILVIVANTRGATEAVTFENIDYVGFPFSISETFQQRNTNSSIVESVKRVEEIQELCFKNNKKLVIYLSMGFGNPYGDAYNEEILLHWADEMIKKEVGIISLADTVGMATPEQISFALNALIPAYPKTEFSAHLHSTAANWKLKLQAAIDAGCLRFEGALKGIGGCPMAGDQLVGNMNSELMINYFREIGMQTVIKEYHLQKALQFADEIFADSAKAVVL